MTDNGAAGHEPDDHAEDHREPSPQSLILERALRELLIEKGVFSDAEVTRQIDNIGARNPALGSMIVAKAWTEPKFKEWLLDDGTAAVESLGIDMTAQPELVDRNFTIHLPVIDWFFGTYYLPRDVWPERLGIEGNPIPDGWLRQLIHPFR